MLILAARKKPRPYVVNILRYEDFIDVKHLAGQFMRNTSRTIDGQTVQWLKIKMLRFEKAEQNLIKFKYNITDENFCVINVFGGFECSIHSLATKPVYDTRLFISTAKKKDLLDFLRTRVILEDYTGFYSNLPSAANQKDRLPVPSRDEEEPKDDGEDEADTETVSQTEDDVNATSTPNNVTPRNDLCQIDKLTQSRNAIGNTQRSTARSVMSRTPINNLYQDDEPSTLTEKRRQRTYLTWNRNPSNYNNSRIENIRLRVKNKQKAQTPVLAKLAVGPLSFMPAINDLIMFLKLLHMSYLLYYCIICYSGGQNYCITM